MKKLMIVAALAATAGAYADSGSCAPKEKEENVALVYQVKMTVKTTKGTTDRANKSSTCNPESEGVLRVKDSTKFEGWIYDCDVCNAVETGTVAMWDSKRKAPFTSAAFGTTFLNVIGKSKKDAEWAWVFEGTVKYGKSDNAVEQTYTLTGAGYGKYDKKNDFYKSFSGYFAGTATASYDLKSENCDPSQVWKCDNLEELTDSDTVAFGTWSVKYSKSASKKYQKGGAKSLKHPSYYSFAE